MANSHLPNCHPDVTPDWQDLDYPRTSFEQAIALEPIQGEQGCYAGFAPNDWCTPHGRGLFLHGGYVAGLLIRASRAYFHDYHDKLNQPDPIHMNLHFLQLIPSGAFHIQLQAIKLGRRHSTIQAKIVSPDTKSPVLYSLAVLTMGNLTVKSGINMDLPPIPIPDRELECARWTSAFLFNRNPCTASLRYYNPSDGESLLWSPMKGRNWRDQWGKLDSGENFRLEHLGLMADLIPPIHMNYQKTELAAVSEYEYRTMSMDFDFRTDPAAKMEWILNRATTYKLEGGRFDMHIQMVDDKGNLVATVHQSNLVFENGREKTPKTKSSL